MTQLSKIPAVVVLENTGITILARVLGWDGSAIVQADVASGLYWVFDLAALPDPIPAGTALTVADVVFDTLQTDAKWTLDDTGYNFALHVPGTSFDGGGKTFRVEIELTPSDSAYTNSKIHIARDVETLELYHHA